MGKLKYFTKEKTCMANKHIKKCLTSLTISEVQSKPQ